MTKDLTIRNSTAEFLIFTAESQEESIEVKYADDNVWLSQKMMAKLFEVSVPTINEPLKNVYQTKELKQEATIRKFLIVQNEGNRPVNREVDFYNLDAIISIGYKVNSHRQKWLTQELTQK